MAISFPANPNENDSFTSNGKTWVWSGGRWKIVGASNRGLSLEISDVAPSNPVQGDMWYESDSGRTYTYYDNVWIELGNTSAVYSFIADDDTDTLIQVEESADEDVIRFDVGGVEKAVLDSSGLSITGDIEVSGSYVGLSSDSVRDADNDTKVEVEVTADSDAIRFTTASTPRFEVTSAGHIIPSEDVTYDLGSSSYRFRDLYLSGNTIDLGGATISYDGTNLHMGAIKMDPSGTGANMMPSGTTAERPVSPTAGMFRFNETTGEPEWYSPAAGWLSFRESPFILAYLAVAGGGGGGAGISGDTGGGGGAGAVIHKTLLTGTKGTYTVTIGSGGSGGAANTGNRGSTGNDTTIVFPDTFTLTAKGGGGGASSGGAATSGGSGGGGTREAVNYQSGASAVTTNSVPSGANVYGNDGGDGAPGAAGGGGGAGEAGVTDGVGDGGDGVQINIDGNNYYWGGGGGGAIEGEGGLGGGGGGGRLGAGGGNAINSGQTPTGDDGGAGGTNTGGGGGGGVNPEDAGGNGGSGIVIFLYNNSDLPTISAGLTYTTFAVGGSTTAATITAGTGTVSWA